MGSFKEYVFQLKVENGGSDDNSMEDMYIWLSLPKSKSSDFGIYLGDDGKEVKDNGVWKNVNLPKFKNGDVLKIKISVLTGEVFLSINSKTYILLFKNNIFKKKRFYPKVKMYLQGQKL